MKSIQLLRNACTVANDPDLPIANRPMSDDQRKAMFAGGGGRGGGGGGGGSGGSRRQTPVTSGPGGSGGFHPQGPPIRDAQLAARHGIPEGTAGYVPGIGLIEHHAPVRRDTTRSPVVASQGYSATPPARDPITGEVRRYDRRSPPQGYKWAYDADGNRVALPSDHPVFTDRPTKHDSTASTFVASGGHLIQGTERDVERKYARDAAVLQRIESMGGTFIATRNGEDYYNIPGRGTYNATTGQFIHPQPTVPPRGGSGGLGILGGPGYQPGDRWDHSRGGWVSPDGRPRVPTPTPSNPHRFPTTLPIEGERWSVPATGMDRFWPGTTQQRYIPQMTGDRSSLDQRANIVQTRPIQLPQQGFTGALQGPQWDNFRRQHDQLMEAGARPVSSTRQGMWFNVPGQGMTLLPTP